MSRYTKGRRRLAVPHFVGVVLSAEQETALDALARDLGGSREQVLLIGLWLLSKVGRSGRDLSVYTEWRGGK